MLLYVYKMGVFVSTITAYIHMYVFISIYTACLERKYDGYFDQNECSVEILELIILVNVLQYII